MRHLLTHPITNQQVYVYLPDNMHPREWISRVLADELEKQKQEEPLLAIERVPLATMEISGEVRKVIPTETEEVITNVNDSDSEL